MAYTALYRQWRPQNFETLVGQQAVKKTLTNALSTGRIAHAYLFTGPRGTGKTSTARILAKALNCEQGPTAKPCGQCLNCERITQGTSMDVFEIDAASNRGIDEIKTLREQLAFTPVDGRYKIYIIDEVHMLTTEAFNALLKTLEEPPAHVIFILATTDPHKIPATIHSRCQRFDFHRVTVEEITDHLAMVAEKSSIAADREALNLIAIQSEGGMRDALSLLDQCGVMGQRVTVAAVREVLGIVGREALRALVQAVGRQDVSAALAQLQELLEQGKDVKQILVEVAEYLRAVLLYKAAPSYNEVYLVDTAEALASAAELFGQERILAAEERIHKAMQEIKGTMRPRITAELCLLDLCRQEGSTLAALAARVEQLERQLASGIVVQQAGIAAVSPANVSTATANTQTVTGSETAKQTYGNTASEAGTTGLVIETSKTIIENRTTEPVTDKGKADGETRTAEPAASESKAVRETKAAPTKQANAAGVEKEDLSLSAGPEPYKAKSPTISALDDTGDVPTGEEYWRNALEILKAEKKNAMVSCARAGRVASFKNNVLVISFSRTGGFQCDRMNKEDYHRAFEDALLRQTRQAIQLRCVMEGAAMSAAPRTAVQKKAMPAMKAVENKQTAAAPAESVATEALPERLQKAKQLFGGSIQKL